MATRALRLGWIVGGMFAAMLSSPATAQFVIGVNTLVDAPDFDMLDGQCDCDNVLAGPQCSLRAALQNANQFGGWVIVSLGPNIYNLTYGGTDDFGVAGDLDIFSGILTRLEINGGPGTVISGAGLIAGLTPDRIFHVTNGVTNTCEIFINGLTISDGAGVSFGAGVHHQGGRLRLTNVWLNNCTANDGGGGVRTTTALLFVHSGGGYTDCNAAFNGGGVMFESTAGATVTLHDVSMANCDVSNNGGAVRVAQNAVVTIIDCSIGAANAAASGGGISNRGTLTVSDTSIAANFASGTGGGIANNIGASLTMNRCALVQNQANIGGGFNNSSGATLTDCTIRLNNADTGGGIMNSASNAAPLRLRNSTVSHNFATGAFGGGGYRGFGAIEAINCTLHGNAAQAGRGGGIYFDGGLPNQVEFNACTIAGNFAQLGGGGLYTDSGFGVTPIRFRTTIIGLNTMPGGVNNNFMGAFLPTSDGFNLDSDGTCAFAQPGDLSGVNPMLGPLQNNGGVTETRALLPGSPAINTGSCTTIAGNTIRQDQRGFLRTAPCDKGSYEAGGIPPPPNDLCAMAPTVLPGSLLFSNVGANTDGPPEAPPCGFSGLPGQDSDVWFEFIAPCDGIATISIAPLPPGVQDRLLAIYPSCPVIGGGPPPLACASSTGGAPAVASIILVAGQSYIIRAGMPGGSQGNSSLDITITCACPADTNGDNVVGVADLLTVIGGWGLCPAPCPPRCPGDVAPAGPPQGNCVVGVSDLLLVIGTWGPCP